ncbi:MAG: hypothetical protein WEF51_00965 [Chloroflexota bacterium]
MPEILTESFCERCGTRYTFESAAPKARLGRFKTLSKGLKNFVLDDATSLDEALASARSDETRESTAQQLDAFHKTFNFCMSCRQYTCPNCWNEAEGQCQSCSPMAAGLSPAWTRGSADAPPAWPVAPAEPAGIEAVAWPSMDRRPAAPEPAPDEVPWPLAALEGRAPVVEPEADAEPEPAIAAEAEPALEPVVEEEPLVTAEAEPTIPDAAQSDIQRRAAAAAANTSDLLARFRPGQSLDDELAAYEASVDATAPAVQPEPEPVAAAEPEPEPVAWAEPEPVAEREPIAWPEAEPAPIAWPEAEPEPVAAMAPEPVVEPEPEPVVWAQPESEQPEDEPVSPWLRPARPAEDIVEVPTWQLSAPEAPVNGHPSEALSPAARADRPTPEWPSQPAESFLAARLAARKAGDDMWAASSVEVLGPAAAAGPAAPVGVQACVSCGLSLSATARFCRRCGTRQG